MVMGKRRELAHDKNKKTRLSLTREHCVLDSRIGDHIRKYIDCSGVTNRKDGGCINRVACLMITILLEQSETVGNVEKSYESA